MLGSQFLGMCIHYLRINRTLHISITLQSTNKVPLINGGTSPFFVWRISAWVDVKEYEKAHPDTIAANGAEQTLKVNLSHAVVSVRLSALTAAYFQP
jgi:hypothetical protein